MGLNSLQASGGSHCMESVRTLWIINQYASTPDAGMGGRHYYLAKELAKQGYKVYVIASASNHLLHSQPAIKEDFWLQAVEGFTFVWVRMPLYENAHSRQRAINWFLFPWRIQRLAKVIKQAPDAILCSSPSVLAFLGARRLAKRFSARLVFEVRDIWPLTLTEIGGYSPGHPFIRLMQWVEDWAYRESEKVVSNLRNAVEHMVSRGMDRKKFFWIPNGYSLDEVSSVEPLPGHIVSQLPTEKFIVGYTGTLGTANALDVLIESADILKDSSDISFVIIGRGKDKASLEKMVVDKHLSNVMFIDAIPKKQIQSMLSHFSACYIGWLKDDLYRFGIAANKLPEYLYSGKPIIHSYSGGCDPVSESNAGIVVEAQDPQALADAILKLYSMTPECRSNLGENGRKAAMQNYDYSMLAIKMSDIIFRD